MIANLKHAIRHKYTTIPDLIASATPTRAMRPRRCAICDAAIPVGTRYSRATYTIRQYRTMADTGGCTTTARICPTCKPI